MCRGEKLKIKPKKGTINSKSELRSALFWIFDFVEDKLDIPCPRSIMRVWSVQFAEESYSEVATSNIIPSPTNSSAVSVNQILQANFEKTRSDDKQITAETGDGNRIVDVGSEEDVQRNVVVNSLAGLNFRDSFVNLILMMTGLLTNRI